MASGFCANVLFVELSSWVNQRHRRYRATMMSQSPQISVNLHSVLAQVGRQYRYDVHIHAATAPT